MKWWAKIERLAKRPRYQNGMRFALLLLFILIFIILNLNIKDFDSEYIDEINGLEVASVATKWSFYEAEDDRVILSLSLPDELAEGSTLAFETDHQTLTARVGNRILYNRSPENPWYLGHEIGRIWNFIHIPHSLAGEVIHLDIDNYAGMRIHSDTAVIGSSKNILRQLIMKTLPLMVYVTVALLIGVILLIFAFATGQRGMKETSGGAVYLAVALIILSLQMAMDSYFAQSIQINPAVAYIIAQTFYIFLPILYMQYLRAKIVRGQLILDALCFGQMLYLLIALLLHYEGIRLIARQQSFIRLLLLVYLLVTAILSIDSLRLSRAKDGLRIPLVAVLCVNFAVAALVLAYSFGRRDFDVFFFVLTIEVFFLGMLLYDQARKVFAVFITAAEARSLKKIAYEDTLTGLLNRSAFDRDMGEINLQLHQFKLLGALILDLNDLKVINDGHGHLQGDYLIASIGKLIGECFGNHGRSYRLGGDEFAVILTDDNVADIAILLDRFIEMIEDYNKSHVLPINIAWGFASMVVAQDIPSDVLINRVLKKADERMYLSKRAQTESNLAFGGDGA